MNEEELINKFQITCLNCQKTGKRHDTVLYIDWEKRYYMITCKICDATVAFDEFGKNIDLNNKEEENVKV